MTTPTILRCGGELEAVVVTSGAAPTFDTTTGHFDSNFSSGALAVDSSRSIGWTDLGTLTTVWARFLFFRVNGSFANTDIFSLNRADGTQILRARGVSSSTTIQFQYNNNTTFVNIGSAQTITGALTTIDVQCVISATVGVYTLFINGVQVAQFTGNNQLITGGTTIGQITFTGLGGNGDAFSEIIVADGDTSGLRLATLRPNATGATSSWTGTFADVDDIGIINDADFISSGTVNQVSTFGLTDLSATAQTMDIVAVVEAIRGRVGATGPGHIQAALHVNSTDYFSSNLANVSTVFTSGHFNVWATNPDTGVDWIPADITNLEAGVKSIT